MQAQSTLQVIAAIAKYRLIAAALRELMLRRAWSLAARVWILCRVSDDGPHDVATRTGAVVRKPSGKEPAGGGARPVPCALWRFGRGACRCRCRRNVERPDVRRRSERPEPGSWPRRHGRTAQSGSRGTGKTRFCGARRTGRFQRISVSRLRQHAHDVSIRLTRREGSARCRGVSPRSKVSMMCMAPPQQGQVRTEPVAA